MAPSIPKDGGSEGSTHDTIGELRHIGPHQIGFSVAGDSNPDEIATPRWLTNTDKTDKAIKRMGGMLSKSGSIGSESSSMNAAALHATASGDSGTWVARTSSLSAEDTKRVNNLKEAYDSVPLEVKSKVGAWRIKDEEIQLGDMLGQGMVGMIYKANWRGSPVAAKCLKDNFSKDTVGWNDLVAEIQILSVLRHPNLVQFLGASLSSDRHSNKPPMIVYELMGGGSLEDLFRKQTSKNGVWKPSRAQSWVWSKDLFRALCFLHQSNPPLLHRDVKPANLLLTSDFQTMKLGDFGLCKALKHGNIEMTGDTGTKRYMAPEVHRNDPHYSVKADIYSGGLTIWLMSTGSVPYADIAVAAIGQRVSLEHHRPSLKDVQWVELRAIIESAWAPLPSDRGTAAYILEQLDKLPGHPTQDQVDNLADMGGGSCRCCVS